MEPLLILGNLQITQSQQVVYELEQSNLFLCILLIACNKESITVFPVINIFSFLKPSEIKLFCALFVPDSRTYFYI